jgi:hypothetical protein
MEDGFSPARPNRSLELESVGQRFNSMVHSGKLRAAVRAVTDHNPRGLYAPNDICTKGMVQAWVGQKTLKCDILRVFRCPIYKYLR